MQNRPPIHTLLTWLSWIAVISGIAALGFGISLEIPPRYNWNIQQVADTEARRAALLAFGPVSIIGGVVFAGIAAIIGLLADAVYYLSAIKSIGERRWQEPTSRP